VIPQQKPLLEVAVLAVEEEEEDELKDELGLKELLVKKRKLQFSNDTKK